MLHTGLLPENNLSALGAGFRELLFETHKETVSALNSYICTVVEVMHTAVDVIKKFIGQAT